MGAWFSRKEESSLEALESLAKQINELEHRRREVELRQRRQLAGCVSYGLILYALAVCGAYFHVQPESYGDWALLALPIIALPSLLLLLRTALQAFYRRQLAANDEGLEEARQRRRRILDEVKEKETYKVAAEILAKYDPSPANPPPNPAATPGPGGQPPRPSPPNSELRQRKPPLPTPADPAPSTPLPRLGTPALPQRPPYPVTPGPGGAAFATPGPPLMTPRLPRPILPAERGKLDKFVDYLLGDGPANRYALICLECRGHNGMALAEEFPYLAFRCAFCGTFNPARQRKPHPPRAKPPTPPLLGGGASSSQASDESRPSSRASAPSIEEKAEPEETDKEKNEKKEEEVEGKE